MKETIVKTYQPVGIAGFLILILLFMEPVVGLTSTSAESARAHLRQAKVYVAAADYRRAVQACQQYIDRAPSVEGYVYLAYVYHAIDGYLAYLAKKDEWGKVGQLSLGLFSRGMLDVVDPPDMLPRMAKEIIHEGLRQQFDLTAAMANRLDKKKVDRLWQEQTAWQENHPERWWAGVPPEWEW